MTSSIGILPWNARSLGNKIAELVQNIKATKAKIICMQETSLPQDNRFHLKIKNFTLLNYSRHYRRGVATFFHDLLHVSNLTRHTTDHLESITADLLINKSFKTSIVNMYVPHQGATLRELQTILPKTRHFIITVDFNARHFRIKD